MHPLRILIGCETSGVMRRAFAARGHDVWSCDLLPAEDATTRRRWNSSSSASATTSGSSPESVIDSPGMPSPEVACASPTESICPAPR
ncbi:hypothetical protein [Rhodovulum sulfidophilum]|uniref:hypothetical protein n=1 Tax=Rhodovulum sulfidophilum TaxID=35806 RepID=UPI00095292C6|nr:hypothetical protein [Rhodovulum sulfidophilum]MBL3554707.1 hypothetical protein [Rhodovulum sulfidophilum]OLS48459.1 hypothetical protein BV379_09375 [Rhodovulum sulfidophilum]